ncbi:MAG TPA: CdaR family protein [Bacillota bacterium]|nr:CdaR family protein [Bacillota bacterium]
MDNWFKSKWFVRGLSLAFAILLYVFVGIEAQNTQVDSRFIPTSSDEFQTLENVEVDIRIDSERFVVSGVPEVVTVTLQGPPAILTPVAKQLNFDVFVDVRELEEGDHTVSIEYDRIPDELDVFIEPSEVDITIEERATEELEISVEYINMDEMPIGTELGEVTINPEVVTITSSRSVIDQIGMVKVYVDVSGLTESISNREVPIIVYDNQGNSLNINRDPEKASISVDVSNPSKEASIQVETVNDLPEGFVLLQTTPEITEVEVFGTSDVLEGIDQIKTEEIDLSDIKETGTIEVDLQTPDGTKLDVGTIEVEVELEQTKTLEEDFEIEVENEDGDQKVTFKNKKDEKTRIKVVGNEKDVKELKDEDFRVYIDVDGLEEGEHEVPVRIEGPDTVTYTTELEEVTIQIGSE